MRIDRRRAIVCLGIAGAWPFPSNGSERASNLPLAALRRGFNLPDQAPSTVGRPTADVATLRRLRELGMTHVRLPVGAESLLPRYSTPTALSRAYDDVTRAIERLIALDYHITFDMHAGADFQTVMRADPPRAEDALLEGWPNLAKRLARWTAGDVSVELLNEPATADARWRPFVERLTQAVRAELPEHWIVVGSAPDQRVDALVNWTPLPDKRIVYACHYYDPLIFTHQGANWEASPWATAEGVPFPTETDDPRLGSLALRSKDDAAAAELRKMSCRAWNRSTILADFQAAAEWSARHGAPVIVNEFGVLKWKAPRGARLNWLTAVREAAEACGLGWTHWEYADSFGLLNDAGTIDHGVIRALLP